MHQVLNFLAKEVWREAPFPEIADRYEVSSFGRVRNRKTGQYVRPRVQNSKGYLSVYLYGDAFRRGKNFRVHRLVALAFLGDPPDCDRIEVNHIDWDNSNNRVDNLEWVSTTENIQHRDARNDEF